jgi:hypothetical protein
VLDVWSSGVRGVGEQPVQTFGKVFEDEVHDVAHLVADGEEVEVETEVHVFDEAQGRLLLVDCLLHLVQHCKDLSQNTPIPLLCRRAPEPGHYAHQTLQPITREALTSVSAKYSMLIDLATSCFRARSTCSKASLSSILAATKNS